MLFTNYKKKNEHQNQSMGLNLSDHLELFMVNQKKDTPTSFENYQNEVHNDNPDSSKSYQFNKNIKNRDDSFIGQLEMPQQTYKCDESTFRIEEKQSGIAFIEDIKQNLDKDQLPIRYIDHKNTNSSNMKINFIRTASQNSKLNKSIIKSPAEYKIQDNQFDEKIYNQNAGTPQNNDEMIRNKQLQSKLNYSLFQLTSTFELDCFQLIFFTLQFFVGILFKKLINVYLNSEDITKQMIKKNESTKKFQSQIKMVTLILPNIRKFFQTKTYAGRTKQLDINVRNYIRDLSDNFETKLLSKRLRLYKLLNIFITAIICFLKLLKLDKIPLINPENPVKLIINSIIVAYNCFYLFIISVEIFFEAHFYSYQDIFNSIATFCWITEMIIQMNTACYHGNHFISDRKIIMRIYLKEYFFFEIIPILFEGKKSSNTFINIMLHIPLLLKIKGMMIILNKLEFYVLQILERTYVLHLFKLCMQVIILGHIIACSWFCIGLIEQQFIKNEKSWIELINYKFNGDIHAHLSWHQYYLEALYWSFSCMMHNSQDKPFSDIELAYASLTMLLSSILFVYLLNSIGAILADIDKQSEDYKRDLNILNQFMKRKKIDLQVLQFTICNKYSYFSNNSIDSSLYIYFQNGYKIKDKDLT